MKSKHLLLCIFSIVLMTCSFGQNVSKSFNPDSLYTYNNELEYTEGRICYLNDYYEISLEKNKLQVYHTVHKVIYLVSDLDIEKFNTLYIPTSSSIELVSFNARSYDSNKTIINFDKEKINNLDNVGNNVSVKLIAFEGVKNHTYLEYSYTLKESLDPYGSIYIEEQLPIDKLSVRYIIPSDLKIEVKAYNGLNEFKQIMFSNENKLLESTSININPLTEEEYSATEPNLPRIEYVTRSFSGFRFNKFDYLSGVKYYHDIVNTYSKGDLRIVRSFQKSMFGKQKEMSIPKIHEKVSKYFLYDSESGSESIQGMFSTRKASNIGLERFYVCYFQLVKIKYQNIIGISRYQKRFDPTFETWSFLKNGFFYFPETRQYFDPSDITAGTGLPPSEFIDTKCLLISESGDSYQILQIENPDKEYTHSDMIIDVIIDSAVEKAIVNVTFKHTGYRAFELWRTLKRFSKKELQNFLINQLKYVSSDSKILESKVIANMDISGNSQPSLIFTGKVELSSILEKANKSYLLKVGELLGEQNELYQQNSRMTDIIFHYPMVYNRIINIEVPVGLTIKNVEDLKINIRSDSSSNPICSFISTPISHSKNKLTISIKESYEKANMDKSFFEKFRSVVNASADFNKLILLFE